MHVQTHILSGWLAGNPVPVFGPRERFFCMLAASLSDLDGLSLLGGWECYYDYHHVLAHNLPFAVVLAGGLAFFSQPRVTAFIVYFLLAHLHLLLDLFGSGEGWCFEYLWPFSRLRVGTGYAWEFYSWQNLTAGALLIVLTVLVVYWKKRTFLEYPMPKLDRELVAWFEAHRPGRKKMQP